LADNIAVVGNPDFIGYFRALGCEIFKAAGGELSREDFDEVMGGRFKIVLVTEEVYARYRDFIRDRSQRTFPVITVIPEIRGVKWADGEPVPGGMAFQELREAVIKAVGQDISGTDD